MQVIIVTDDDLAPFGRQIAHAISNQEMHSGTFWSVKHYKDNEAQIDGKQPVIFLGNHELTDSYIKILPERFQLYETRCYHEGSKAVLVANTPDDVSANDLKTLQAAIDQHKHKLRELAKAAKEHDAGFNTTAGFTAGVGGAIWDYSLIGFIMWVIYKYFSASKRRQEYKDLQYQYLLARFLSDEFELYMNGIQEN